MNLIVFMTAAGSYLAMLGLSDPVAPQRHCIFIIHPLINKAAFQSKEGRIVFPDRPTEYPCAYTERKDGATIAFTNQNDWHFEVRVARGNQGSWTASKGDERVSGRALYPENCVE
ncbi:hypothetical protein [Bradyrhizobium iriomotense]|uniref:Uncharacterized protein n=1 Tax=Bradyrhizobium iriomotense TaxID=441950 RepID=A0ABQ6AZU9_9BRAD|nr:hypothetical protein [Bradyrhizobium iriomotense]GLR87101.1 hypothetical protein GCM10007857_38120 [Bradyrhizobium iriomotense]